MRPILVIEADIAAMQKLRAALVPAMAIAMDIPPDPPIGAAGGAVRLAAKVLRDTLADLDDELARAELAADLAEGARIA